MINQSNTKHDYIYDENRPMVMGDRTNEAVNTSNSSRARGAVRENPHKVDLKNIRRSLPGDDDNDVGSDPDSGT